MSTLNEKIRSVRTSYERERAELKKKYDKLISSKKAEITEIERTDFYLDYMEGYSSSLSTLEDIYRDIEDIQDRTLGISFRVGKYISTIKARECDGSALDYFDRLVAECRDAIIMVKNSTTIEGDVEPLKRFCQGLLDLRYLNANSRALLKKDGTPDREKAEALRNVKAELEDILEEEKSDKKFENMKCYGDCIALREEINSVAHNMDELRLGDAPKGEDGGEGGYKFLIGFTEVNLPREDREFAEDFLGADSRGLSAYPVYFNYTSDHSAIIFRAKGEDIYNNKALTFARNLYFSMAGSIFSSGIRYFGAECNPTDNTVIGKIAAKINSTFSKKYVVTASERPSAKNFSDIVRGLDAMDEIWSERSDAYDDEIANIFDYNKKNPDGKQPFIMANIWGYPDLFNADSSGRSYESLKKFIHGRGDDGFITVIGEKIDGDFTDKAPKIDAEKMNADVIEMDSKGNFFFNGVAIDTNIEGKNFDVGKYWSNLKLYNEKQVSTALSDTMHQLEKDRARGIRKKVPFYEKFVIPMGANEDTTGFDVEISFNSNQCFGIILGGTRSGKSSFLHSFILSACSQYAPDEVQFYLADFKEGGEEAPEFSNYKKTDGFRNLCMPHVRYLLLKSSPENTLDLLKKIIALMRERNAAIKPYSSCYEYNKAQAKLGDKGKKMPFIFFLIDEANNMLSGGLSGSSGESNDARGDAKMLTEIKNKIALILKLSASSGIGVIFAGQDTTGFTDAHIAQMGTRICLKVDNEQIFRDIFNIQYSETSKMISRLDKGRAYYTGQGMKLPPVFVRTAYAGSTTGEQALSIAERVRAQYANDDKFKELYDFQVLAGNEDFMEVDKARKTEAVALAAKEAEEQDEITKAEREEEGFAITEYVHYHNILMGLSSAAAIPSYLKYDTHTNSRNYFAVAPEQKLIPIERTAIFSFLETFTNSDGTCPDVSYYALPNIRKASLDGILAKVPALASCITVMHKQSELAYKIMELGKLFNERLRMLRDDVADRFDPVFLVLHDPEFIYNKKNIEWVPDFSGGKKTSAPAAAPASEKEENALDILDGELDFGDSDEEMLAFLNGVNPDAMAEAEAQKPARRVNEDTSGARFTAGDVRETLTTLFNQGNRYSIYLLVLATSEKAIDMMQSGTTGSHDYCVYSSLADMRGKKDAKSGAGSVYIIPDGVKTRLLNYRISEIKKIVEKFN